MTTLRLALALMLAGLGRLQAGEQPIQFNRDIRPILAENCFYCHGPDPAARKASLRLDREEGFFGQRENGQTVIKGKPDESPLYQRLTSEDKDEKMPPPKAHHILKPAQIALLKDWIAQGAPWQPHWSLVKPERPAIPEVKDAAWAKNSVDRFVLAKLQSLNLTPAAEADRRTLLRRVSLDLTGLPPNPPLVEQFVNDKSPDAYEKVVDYFMASSHYGEHRARYWLDAARYGDTHGVHIDNYREIWPYRDWVIKSFNDNLPFDQFTIDQLAGDLLPNPTQSQLIATGFHRCNITTAEGGTIPEENLANYARDRVETTSWVWLGLTANCAVCHDHKFDPITQKDFYAMSAFFRNTTQPASDGNVRDTAPVLVMPEGKDAARWHAIPDEKSAQIAKIAAQRKTILPEFEKWYASAQPADVENRIPGAIVTAPLSEGQGSETQTMINGQPLALALDSGAELSWTPGKTGSALKVAKGLGLNLGDVANFERNQAFSISFWVNAPMDSAGGSVVAKMDVAKNYRGWDVNMKGADLQVYLVNKWPEDSILVSTAGNALKRGEWRHVTVTYDGSGRGGGVQVFVNGNEAKLRVEKNTLKGSIMSETPLRIGQRSASDFFSGAVQDLHIFNRELSPLEIREIGKIPAVAVFASKRAAERKPPERAQLFEVFAASDAESAAASSKMTQLDREKKAIQDRSVVTHIQEEKKDTQPMARILFRGQYDQPKEEVGAAVITALHPMPKGAPANRLGLAEWLVAPENPLTARVIVNRMWQEVFGTGIVKSAEDFGIMGETPSNPELLDWLAVEFRESGWDSKRIMRLMVTSAAYRQSAIIAKEKLERDPQNRFLSRGPRFRMDAEMVRDYALAASGLLTEKIGGPSVKPYQPEGVWEAVAMPGSNTSVYKRDAGDALYRRSMYTFWKRAAPPPAMEVFNAPSRESACLRRERTNTPLQALVTLNDPQFIEAARALAERALKAALNDGDSPIQVIAARLLGRPLRGQEVEIVKKNQRDLFAYYSAHPDETKALLAVGDYKNDPALPAPQLAAWTMSCNQLMNLDEVLCK